MSNLKSYQMNLRFSLMIKIIKSNLFQKKLKKIHKHFRQVNYLSKNQIFLTHNVQFGKIILILKVQISRIQFNRFNLSKILLKPKFLKIHQTIPHYKTQFKNKKFTNCNLMNNYQKQFNHQHFYRTIQLWKTRTNNFQISKIIKKTQ